MRKLLPLLAVLPIGSLALMMLGGSDSKPTTKPTTPGPKPGGSTSGHGGSVPASTGSSLESPDGSLPLEVKMPGYPDALPGQISEGSGDGLEWANSLPFSVNKVRQAQKKPRWKDYVVAREEAILKAVRDGMANYEWSSIVLGPVDGTYLTLPVFTRTLRIGKTNPVRVSVNYKTEQQIADLLGGSMMTALVADEVYRAADVKADPHPTGWDQDGTMATTDGMVDYSQTLDKSYPQDVTNLTNPILANENKDWILSSRFWHDDIGIKLGRDHSYKHGSKELYGANYGWYAGPMGHSAVLNPAWRSSPPLQVIQSVGLVHNFGHVDYSQQVRLMGLFGALSGKKNGIVHVGRLLRDPVLHKLLSYEGQLPSWKHPAFPTGGEPPPMPGEQYA